MEPEEKVTKRSRKLLIAAPGLLLFGCLAVWISHLKTKLAADKTNNRLQQHVGAYEFSSGSTLSLDLDSLGNGYGGLSPTLLPSGRACVHFEKPNENQVPARTMLNANIGDLYRYVKERPTRIANNFRSIDYDLAESDHGTARWLISAHMFDRLAHEDLESAIESALVLTADSWWTTASSGTSILESMGLNLWILLQYPHWNEEKLALLNDRLTALWSDKRRLHFFSTTRAAIRFEFATARSEVKPLRAFWKDFTDGIFVHSGLIPRAFNGLQRDINYQYWESYREEQNNLSVLSTNLLYWQQGFESMDLATACRTARDWHNRSPLVSSLSKHKPLFDGRTHVSDIGPEFLAQAAALETLQRLTLTAIAIERFRLRYNRLPDSLDDLKPGFANDVPIDVMDGKPLRYKKLGGQRFKLHSVGLDGKDAEGHLGLPAETYIHHFRWTSSRFYRMWFSGDDWVWPLRATQEEEKEELKRIYKDFLDRQSN